MGSFLRGILGSSESWVGIVGLLLPILPIPEDVKKGLVYPIWTYVAARLTSKVAKAATGSTPLTKNDVNAKGGIK